MYKFLFVVKVLVSVNHYGLKYTVPSHGESQLPETHVEILMKMNKGTGIYIIILNMFCIY